MIEESPTILVAEDEEVLRELFTLVLSRAGYRVLAAESGEEALQVSQPHKVTVDLLLTDINLASRMNGYQLAECLSKTFPALKVVYMSGFLAEPEAFETYIRRPDRGFLRKPFRLPVLLRMVTELLS
jgi:CheY-like chemotaxis protein